MKVSRSQCPVNQALEVFGDKWTLLVVRDIMFGGKRHFREMLASEEKIASNILTDRLNKLEDVGILIKTSDPDHKQKNIYTLTPMGIELMPIMILIGHWSGKYRDVSDEGIENLKVYKEGGQTLLDQMANSLLKEYEKVLALKPEVK